MNKIAEECLTIYRTLGDKQGEIDALILSGRSMFAFAQIPQHDDSLQQALHLSRSLGDKWRSAYILWQLCHATGMVSEARNYIARNYIKEAITLFRETGDWGLLATCLGHLAFGEAWYKEFESAQMHVDESIQIRQIYKIKGNFTNTLTAQGYIETTRGNFDKAQSLLEEAISTASKRGNHYNHQWGRVRLAHILIQQGKTSEARAALVEIMREFHQDGNDMGVIFSLEGMAGIYSALGKHKVAAQLIGWANTIRKKLIKTNSIRPPIEQTDVDKIIAACQTKMGEVDFSDAYDNGGKMSLDEAVDYALGEN